VRTVDSFGQTKNIKISHMQFCETSIIMFFTPSDQLLVAILRTHANCDWFPGGAELDVTVLQLSQCLSSMTLTHCMRILLGVAHC
jgi:hypothetical protein